MGIANELTSDVAAALLAYNNDQVPFETERLPEIIRRFHFALRDLSNKERSKRIYSASADAASARNEAGRH